MNLYILSLTAMGGLEGRYGCGKGLRGMKITRHLVFCIPGITKVLMVGGVVMIFECRT